MPLSDRAAALADQVTPEDTRMSQIRALAKTIKTDHALALELWSTEHVRSRQLAVLLFDKKKLDEELVDSLCADLAVHPEKHQTNIMEWLMVNQLSKSAAGRRLMESWEHSDLDVQRRTFWYHQARLRWRGKTPPGNTVHLLDALDARLANEVPMVQMMMNFAAGWSGVYEPEHRDRCVALGERTGLYRDEVVPRGCAPQYLPEFIREGAHKAGT